MLGCDNVAKFYRTSAVEHLLGRQGIRQMRTGSGKDKMLTLVGKGLHFLIGVVKLLSWYSCSAFDRGFANEFVG